jgi:hypothetical protein
MTDKQTFEFFYVNEMQANFPAYRDAVLRASIEACDIGCAKVYGVTPAGESVCLLTLYKGEH